MRFGERLGVAAPAGWWLEREVRRAYEAGRFAKRRPRWLGELAHAGSYGGERFGRRPGGKNERRELRRYAWDEAQSWAAALYPDDRRRGTLVIVTVLTPLEHGW